MYRYLLSCLLIALVIALPGIYFFQDYWVHRYDALIARQAGIYRLDEKLVWSVIYQETYFRAWKIGSADEVGLMQVTPAVAREWARETGFKEFEKQTTGNVTEFLSDPERNIQVGCWYLEKLREQYRDLPAETAMTLGAYNAGPSRVDDWTKGTNINNLSESEFVNRIDIPSTKSYVSSILARYRANQGKPGSSAQSYR
jgi:Soluble lytic murein transglycosylase and related regulatory proteins (some contain LysM/invasin domains)